MSVACTARRSSSATSCAWASVVELRDERVLGRQHGIGHAEARVRARGEDLDVQIRASLDGQAELGALGSTDPVTLHGLHTLGPVEAVERVQQLVGIAVMRKNHCLR